MLIFIGESVSSFNIYNTDTKNNKLEMTIHNLSLEESILDNLTHINGSRAIYFTKNGHFFYYLADSPYAISYNDLNSTNETNDLYRKVYDDYQRDFSLLERLLINSASKEKLDNLTNEDLNYLKDLSELITSNCYLVSISNHLNQNFSSNSRFIYVLYDKNQNRSSNSRFDSFLNDTSECNWRNVDELIYNLIHERTNKDFIICTCPPCNNRLYLRITDYERIDVFPSELMIEGSLNNPHSMPNCMRIDYKPNFHSYAEAIWPLSNNNDTSIYYTHHNAYNLTNIKKVVFFARGEKGGERAEFYFADRSLSTGVLVLHDSWQEYSINVTGNDLKSVKQGFAYASNVYQNPVGCTIYVDDIRLDD